MQTIPMHSFAILWYISPIRQKKNQGSEKVTLSNPGSEGFPIHALTSISNEIYNTLTQYRVIVANIKTQPNLICFHNKAILRSSRFVLLSFLRACKRSRFPQIYACLTEVAEINVIQIKNVIPQIYSLIPHCCQKTFFLDQVIINYSGNW